MDGNTDCPLVNRAGSGTFDGAPHIARTRPLPYNGLRLAGLAPSQRVASQRYAAPPMPDLDSEAIQDNGTSTPVASVAMEQKARRSLMRRRVHVGVRTLDLLQHRSFRLYWFALWMMRAQFWIENVVVGWLAYDLTRSPLLTGMAIGLNAFPILVVGPLSGVFIDAMDRRKVLAASLAAQGVLALVFGAIVILDRTNAVNMFVFILLNGVAAAVRRPVETAVISNVVPRVMLMNAFALSQLASSATRLMVPAATGLLIAFMGPGPTLLIGVALLAVAIVAILRTCLLTDAVRRTVHARSMLSDLREGVRYIRREPIVLGLVVLMIVALLFIAPVNLSMMPVYASEVYHAGPEVLGLLESSIGLGMTIGTVALASIGNVRRKGLVVLLSLVATAIGMIAFSQSTNLLVSLMIIVLYSSALVSFWTIAVATIQEIVPDEIRGRITALSAVSEAAFPVGTLFVGAMAQALGAPTATVIAGVSLILVVGAFAVAFPAVARYR